MYLVPLLYGNWATEIGIHATFFCVYSAQLTKAKSRRAKMMFTTTTMTQMMMTVKEKKTTTTMPPRRGGR